MVRRQIPLDRLALRVFHSFDARWMLLAAGSFAENNFNVMTISWGGLGVIWGKPFAQVYVRESRHTRQFMDDQETFTLSVFPDSLRKGLSYCGSHSGRDGDKVRAAGFTAMASQSVAAPIFDEAELAIECRTMYFCDLQPGQFLDPSIGSNYQTGNYHRIYFGEVVSVSGTNDYLAED